MSTVEVATMDRMQKTGRPPQAILAKLQSARAKRGVNGPSQTAVYRFLNGSSYARGQEERRGRKASIPDGLPVWQGRRSQAGAEDRIMELAAAHALVDAP